MPYGSQERPRIWWTEAGQGSAIVLLHANPFDHRMFLHQTARWSARHRVIAIDLRAYGRSDKPEHECTLADLATDISSVCDDCEIAQAVFVGVSVGSGIAMKIALERPTLAQALVLVGGSSRGPRRVDAILANIGEPDLAAWLLALMRGYVAPGFADTEHGEWLLKLFSEQASGLSAAAISQVFRARASADLSGKIPALRLPTLVVNGAFDGSLPAGRETATLIPGAEHVVIANAGHACCLERPAAFDRAVIPFLAKHGLWNGPAPAFDDRAS